jgi:hypothetical protein
MLVALYTAGFSGLKFAVEAFENKSVNRKYEKAVEKLDVTARRLTGLRDVPPEFPIEEYRKELKSMLGRQQQELVNIAESIARLEERKTQDPAGLRKWLGLYRPENFACFIAQFWVFLCGIYAAIGIFGFLKASYETGWIGMWADSDSFANVVSPVTLAALVFFLGKYCSNAAFRMKRFGNAQRRGEIGAVNTDLSVWQKILLRFQPMTKPIKRRRASSYFLLFIWCVGTISILFTPPREAWLVEGTSLLYLSLFLGLGEVARSDALLVRVEESARLAKEKVDLDRWVEQRRQKD